MNGGDVFESLLGEELVRLHRRLILEHRRQSTVPVSTSASRTASEPKHLGSSGLESCPAVPEPAGEECAEEPGSTEVQPLVRSSSSRDSVGSSGLGLLTADEPCSRTDSLPPSWKSQEVPEGRSVSDASELAPHFESEEEALVEGKESFRRPPELPAIPEGGARSLTTALTALTPPSVASRERSSPRQRRRASSPVQRTGSEASSSRQGKASLRELSEQLAAELQRRPSLAESGGHVTSTPPALHGFEVLPVWERSGLLAARPRLTLGPTTLNLLGRRNSSAGLTTSESTKAQSEMAQAQAERSPLTCFIMSPSTLRRLAWDFAAMLLIIYDCLVLPLVVFDVQLSFAPFMVWLTRLFWTSNIPVSAATGYLKKDGTVEMRPAEVFKNYARTWFTPDCIVVGIDWAEVIVDLGGVSLTRLGNVLRLLRIVRVIRIVRFIKAPEMMDFFNEYIRSEQVLLVASLGKVILLTLSVTHIVACLWYGVGRIEDEGWIMASNAEGLEPWQQYLICFHWSLAQFAGELLIEPRNKSERAFTVVVLFLAIIASAMFVSSLTTSMTRLQILSSKQSSQLATLRRFLLDRNISRPLATRVQQNAQYALQEVKKDIPESSVDLLAMISTPLLVELHFEIYSQVLLEHPFFKCYMYINPGGVQKVCNQAVKLFTMHKGDLLFSDYEVPSSKRMYFITSGSLSYSQVRRLPTFCEKHQWMCEAFLWTSWSHCGSARACQTSRLLAVDAEKFASLVSTFPTPHARNYAELFVEALNLGEEHSDVETLRELLDDFIEDAFPVAESSSPSSPNSRKNSADWGTASQDSGRRSNVSTTQPSELRQSASGRSSQRNTRVSQGKHMRASEVAKKLSKLSRRNTSEAAGVRGWCAACCCACSCCGSWLWCRARRCWACACLWQGARRRVWPPQAVVPRAP